MRCSHLQFYLKVKDSTAETRRKILFLTSRFPWPLEKGDKLRAYHFIKCISLHADVYLFALSDEKLSDKQLSAIQPYCKEVEVAVIPKFQSVLLTALSLFSEIPFQVAWFTSSSAIHKLQQFVNKHQPDRLFCHLLRMGEYAQKVNIGPAVIDYMDAFSKGMERYADAASFWIRPFARIETKRLRKYEVRLFDHFRKHSIISTQDRDCIAHPSREKISVIPNGVDLDYYKPVSTVRIYDLIFLGNMAYPPNIASAVFSVKKILPALNKVHPGCKLLIAGAAPVQEVRALTSAQVEVSGWVEDVRTVMAQSRIMIAPMLISIGLQNKILQAMAMKIPCVISTLANNAIGAKNEFEVLIADTPEEYAKQIYRLLTDENLRQSIAENAFQFVHANFNWEQNGRKLISLIE